jgi:hypothetical protein
MKRKPAKAPALADVIAENASQICKLHARIQDTLRSRGTAKGRLSWEKACADFNAKYDALAFPGGYKAGLQRIRDNDPEALETALLFLEKSPYFFRSGFIRSKLLTLLGQATLTPAQQRRLQAVVKHQMRAAGGTQPADA